MQIFTRTSMLKMFIFISIVITPTVEINRNVIKMNVYSLQKTFTILQ